MSFLKNIFKSKEQPIKSYADFWNWFRENEKGFYKAVKHQDNIEKKFFDRISPKLDELKEGFWYLTGMADDTTAELVLTADGKIKNIVFVEELVHAAPKIEGWKFTALKAESEIENVSIKMAGYSFTIDNLSFYSNDLVDYPDEIDITIIHNDFNKENRTEIKNGSLIFLDIYLGELNFAVIIDRLTVKGPGDAEKELIPISKLKDFLNWRQKEFIERYEADLYEGDNEEISLLKIEDESGYTSIAAINLNTLLWAAKVSHPWILVIEIPFNGNERGVPDEKSYKLFEEIEDVALEELNRTQGHIHIGHQTLRNVREIYFACKDFRKPSKVISSLAENYAGEVAITYDIYKDKYWSSFNHYHNAK